MIQTNFLFPVSAWLLIMAQRTLPLLFINLGGEMMYILDQRLRAQAIESDKAAKVRTSPISLMPNKSSNAQLDWKSKLDMSESES